MTEKTCSTCHTFKPEHTGDKGTCNIARGYQVRNADYICERWTPRIESRFEPPDYAQILQANIIDGQWYFFGEAIPELTTVEVLHYKGQYFTLDPIGEDVIIREEDVRKKAAAKLTPLERKVLGL